MVFKDRTEAGKLLAEKLSLYQKANVVVYALPRGGVIPAVEIAKRLSAPLDLIITRKIGHPYNPEYAVAAIAENGHIVGTKEELEEIDTRWLQRTIEEQRKEVKRRKNLYGLKQTPGSLTDKTVILVDDGIATGLTMRIAIKEIKHLHPKKIVVAIPVISQNTFRQLEQEVDQVVALHIPDDEVFLGAVGAYYENFPQIEDEEVTTILTIYEKQRQSTEKQSMPQPMIDPTLFTFSPYHYIAKQLLEIPNFTHGDFTLKRFPNREFHITLDSHAAERKCIVLGSLAPSESNLFSFLLLCHTLQKENAYKIIAVLPYLSYSRQDKKERFKSYATDMIGKLLSAAGVNEVITIDIHSIHDKELFPIPLISLSPAKIFAKEIKKLHLTDATIVAPDEGAKRRAQTVAKEAGSKQPIAYAVKKRTADDAELIEFHGNVGKKAVIIDDMLDTGQTLISVCKKLLEKDVEEITIMVTHGLFTGKAWEELWNLGVTKIYCTDAIPLPKHITNKIRVLSIIPLLNEKLKEENKEAFTVDISNQYDFI